MKRFTLPRTIALTLTCALGLAVSAPVVRADDSPPADAKPAEAPVVEAPAVEAPTEATPEPERLEGVKLIKIDAEGKSITVLVAPDAAKAGRAYKRYKLMIDDKSLILVDQQPSTMKALQTGMRVDVGFFKKGKNDVLDTLVVIGKDE
jgi:hypothetical protein